MFRRSKALLSICKIRAGISSSISRIVRSLRVLLILWWVRNCSFYGIRRHHSNSVWLEIRLRSATIMPGEKLLNWSLLVLITITLKVHWGLAISCLSSISPKCSITRSSCTLSLHSILLGTISRIRMLEL